MTFLKLRRTNTSPMAPGIAEKLEGVLSPTNHWYFKINWGSTLKVLSWTKVKWQAQVSSSKGLSIEASLSRYPGGNLSFHCSTKNWNVDSVHKITELYKNGTYKSCLQQQKCKKINDLRFNWWSNHSNHWQYVTIGIEWRLYYILRNLHI